MCAGMCALDPRLYETWQARQIHHFWLLCWCRLRAASRCWHAGSRQPPSWINAAEFLIWLAALGIQFKSPGRARSLFFSVAIVMKMHKYFPLTALHTILRLSLVQINFVYIFCISALALSWGRSYLIGFCCSGVQLIQVGLSRCESWEKGWRRNLE